MIRSLLPALVLAALPAAAAPGEEPAYRFEQREFLAAKDAALEHADVWKRWAEEYSREMRTSMGAMFAGRVGAGKVVKGAPYSAEVVTEANQSLADGNVITRHTSGAVYRDGEGRTRQESGSDDQDRSIFITDPVEQKSYVLTPGAKRAVATPYNPPRNFSVAHDLPYAREISREASREASRERAKERVKNRQVVRADGTEVRIEDGRVFVDGREVPGGTASVTSKSGKEVRVENGKVFVDGREIRVPEPPLPPVPPVPPRVVVQSVEDSGDGTRREEVRVQVIRSRDELRMPLPPAPPMPPGAPTALPPLPPLPPMPGVQTMRFESTARLGKGVTTNLGTREFDGVKAEGRSTVWTIPAGQIGNRNPINVSSETWYSPELQVTVYARHNDPRTGETLYRLAGIKRGEPAPALFKVPEEYQLRDRTRK